MTKYTKQIGMIISLMTCTSLPLIAQEVKGRVMDEAKQPVEAATVIMQTPDSIFIDAVITDSLGYFTFPKSLHVIDWFFNISCSKPLRRKIVVRMPGLLLYKDKTTR